jgi:hypothetical protein
VLDAIEEPVFAPPPEDGGGDPLSWYNYPQIPPVLVGRFKVG